MGSGFSKMKKQARLMEQQLEEMKQNMKNTTVTGSSGNGLVTVTINGDKEIKDIKIKPECVDKDDVEGLEDLIKAAVADAHTKLSSQSSSIMPGGMPFPF